jgi:tetratricopeptide (TPR) repeat protein
MASTSITLGPLVLVFGLSTLFQIATDTGDLIQQHLDKAQQSLARHRPDLAIPEFEAALALDPTNLDAQANLGVLLYFGGEFAKAVPHLRIAVKGQPSLCKIQALLGLAEHHLKDANNARTDLESALPHLKGEKVQLPAGNALIDIYTAAGELEKASGVASGMLDSNPTDASLLLTSYRINSDLANQSMLTLAVSAPHSAETHQVMAIELSRRGDWAAALSNYREAIRINPKLPGLYFQFGNLLYSSSDEKLRSEAEAQFRAALAVNPQDEKAQLMLGMVAKRRGDLKAAYDAFARAVEMQPNDADACAELAQILIYRHELDKARALLAHAIEIDPTDYVAYYRLGTADRLQGKAEESKHDLAEYRRYRGMKEKLQSLFQPTRFQPSDEDDDKALK